MNNPRFPVDVLKARLKRDPLLALELVNPELDLVRQLALNGKTRAIREQAMRKLDELYLIHNVIFLNPLINWG